MAKKKITKTKTKKAKTVDWKEQEAKWLVEDTARELKWKLEAQAERDEERAYNTFKTVRLNACLLGWAVTLLAIVLNTLFFFQFNANPAYASGIAFAVLALGSSYIAETLFLEFGNVRVANYISLASVLAVCLSYSLLFLVTFKLLP